MTQNEVYPWIDNEDKEYVPPFSGCDVPAELFYPEMDLRMRGDADIKESEEIEI